MQVYQSRFTQQIANWVKSQGRTMMGWSEIMNGGTVTNASLMDWLNTRAVQAATNSFAEKTDWRVPNVKELRSLVAESCP